MNQSTKRGVCLANHSETDPKKVSPLSLMYRLEHALAIPLAAAGKDSSKLKNFLPKKRNVTSFFTDNPCFKAAL